MPTPVPNLPDELWTQIVRASGIGNGTLFALSRVTRDACYELVRRAHGLNHKQAMAYVATVYLGRSIFLTGGAGVGKTFTANRIVERVCAELGTAGAVGIVAPTGAAARVASCATVRTAADPQTSKPPTPQPPTPQPSNPRLDGGGLTRTASLRRSPARPTIASSTCARWSA